MKVKKLLPGERFQSSSPTPFIGHSGYPYVNVGLLAPPVMVDNVWEYDAPLHWSAQDYQIPKIVEFRSSLINSRTKASVKSRDRMLEISQEVGLSSIPVDIDVTLKKKPEFLAAFDNIAMPLGPYAELKKVELSSTPKIPHKVDKVSNDELKAVEGITYLYDSGFDEHYLTKVLSVGALGLDKSKRMVPTKWSITATDDMLGKHIHKELLDLPEVDNLAFYGSYLGNYYLVLFFPGLWSYELFEMYTPRTKWNKSPKLHYMTDHEDMNGRKDYAESTAGGYYAARLGIMEKLKSMKRQGRVLALRFITEEYTNPLGVWVVREAVRKAMKAKPIQFSGKELAIRYAKSFASKKFGQDITEILQRSILLTKGEQKGLVAFK